MKTYNEFLTELFDNPYPTSKLSDMELDSLDPAEDDYVRKFQTKDGETFFVHIDGNLNSGVFINSAGRFGITGEKGPEAAKIISTVLNVGKEYLQKEKPPELEFSASAEEKSRISLYKRIAQKHTPKEYTMKVVSTAGNTSFIMQRNDNLKEDYRGEHQAAGKEGAPLHDMTHNEVYPKDYYDRWHEYAQDEKDAALIVNGYRNKPNRQVMIYRAVPHNQTKEERLDALEKAQAMWLRRNKVHPEFQKEYQKLGAKKYYEWLGDEEEKVKKSNAKVENIDSINPGDWVTIVRRYAKEHGQDNLNNKFRIISKKVKAKDVYTDGNSLAEFGYAP